MHLISWQIYWHWKGSSVDFAALEEQLKESNTSNWCVQRLHMAIRVFDEILFWKFRETGYEMILVFRENERRVSRFFVIFAELPVLQK